MLLMKTFRLIYLSVILIVLALGLSCSKDESGPTESTTNKAPEEPVVVAPGNGATDQPLVVTLQWTCTDPDSDPITYDVHFGTNSNPPLVSSTQSSNSYTPNALSNSTKYYWRIVAKDDHAHSTSSSPWEFTTVSLNAPVLSTSSVTAITPTTAQSGGTVTSDGGASITARGVCWGTNTEPTISDHKTIDSSGIGNFTSSIIGLTAGTPYYVRAYATNSVGTGYGNTEAFTTEESLFEPAVNYGAGSGPSSVYAADLDGDGHDDLAVANQFSANVSILINNRDGTFASAVNYGVGDLPFSVYAADLDGDGDDDLAVGEYHGISILINNRDGTFASAVNYGAGDGSYYVYAADLDGDGYDDLAVANDSVSILINNRDGTFASAVNYGAGDYPTSVHAADLDGDGHDDLAVAIASSDNVSILKNKGDGTFASAVNYGAGDAPCSIYAADLDGDGDDDLAVAIYNSDNVSILKNNGDGTFASAGNYGVGDVPFSVYAADLDGDGDYDLAVANVGSDNVSILINDTVSE